ncbi:hypothetical protein PYR71_15175 [Rhizobium sp. MC63]|uniref:Uncharacterized protein n=1 Tax=Rhizobium mulingense TaxID=3031128 RepID=A0ACC6N4C8_9HYPH|nr:MULTISPECIES: hypothetical protein [unclassified Rhizobium]MDF0697824.1 hypothetical protein [Rhizobium sp. MC63]MEA3520526.1 hypothetical protein [Rhizobium sp. MJ31]MEB3043765.1 hypothetical protein [Rhizobium sp. MJ21]
MEDLLVIAMKCARTSAQATRFLRMLLPVEITAAKSQECQFINGSPDKSV